jgi:hypothetical protein
MNARSRLAAIAVSFLAVGAGLVGPAHARATNPTVRYASPTGISTGECPKTAPCDLVTALATAVDGDTVVIEAGSYDKSSPLTTVLEDDGKGLTIHGPATGTLPVIYSAADEGMSVEDSTVSRIAMVYSGAGEGLNADLGSYNHVAVYATSGTACEADVFTDSLCVATGADQAAMVEEAGDTGGPPGDSYPITLRGDTALGLGSGGIGLLVEGDGSVVLTTNATNDIFKGAAEDIETDRTGDPATYPSEGSPVIAVTTSHDDFKTEAADTDFSGVTGTQPTSETIHGSPTDITAVPKFVDVAKRDFAEAAGSPTIDKGAADPGSDTDLAGNPRTVGAAPDIGAYEYLDLPAVGHIKVTSRGKHAISGTVSANGERLSAKLKISVISHGHVVTPVDVKGRFTGATTKTFHVHGLRPDTKYTLKAIVTSQAGTTTSAPRKVKTRN